MRRRRTSRYDRHLPDELTPRGLIRVGEESKDSATVWDPNVALSMNPKEPEDRLRALDWRANPSVAFGLAANPSAPKDVLEEMADAMGGRLRWRPSLSGVQDLVFDSIFDRDNLRVRRELNHIPVDIKTLIAFNANAPQGLLERLSRDRCIEVRRGVAENPSAGEGVLERLSKDRYAYVRAGVAINSNTPERLFKILSMDTDPIVRDCLVSNPRVPEELHNVAAVPKDKGKMMGLARSPDTEERMLRAIYSTQKFAPALAGNPSTPQDMLRDMASKRYGSEYQLWEGAVWRDVATKLVANPNTPLDVLESMSKDPELRGVVKPEDIRACLARTVSDAKVLNELAGDHHTYTRLNVANNTNAATDTLDILADDESKEVVLAVAKNRHTGWEALRRIAEMVEGMAESDGELAEYGVETRIRQAVLQNPNSPPDVIERIRRNIKKEEEERKKRAEARRLSRSEQDAARGSRERGSGVSPYDNSDEARLIRHQINIQQGREDNF